MGKNLQQKHSGISAQNNHPGCMWGILNILKYHHWRYIKKRLPHKRRYAVGARNAGNNIKISNADDFQAHSNDEEENSTVKEKSRKPILATKSSVKARIKALITEDKSKRKGRHHRTSTYPIQSKLARSDSIHRLEPLDEDPFTEIVSNVVDQNNETSSAISSPDPLLWNSSDESSSSNKRREEFGTLLTGNELSNKVDENGKQMLENHRFLQEDRKRKKHTSLIHAEELTMDASPCQSKVFLDALNLINMNKDFLVNILPDPGSPLVHHFHSQHTFSTKMGLSKSGSFPVPGSSGRGGPESSLLKHKEDKSGSYAKEKGKSHVGGQGKKSTELDSTEDICKQSMPLIAAEYRADGILKLNQVMAETADNSSDSCHHPKRHGENQVAVKRFKDLKEKLRYALKQSKDEMQRITMDAVLHKIPRKHGFSKDLKKEIFDQFKNLSMNRSRKDSSESSYETDHSVPSISKSGLRHMRRTSSLSESMDRYLQLYECSFNREAKHQISDRLQLGTQETELPCRSAPKYLGRILSLPELKSYSYPSEVSLDVFSSGMHVDSSVSLSGLNEQKSVDIPTASEDQSQLDTYEKTEIPEHDICQIYSVTEDQLGLTSVANCEAKSKVSEISDDLGNLVAGDSTFDNEHNIEPARKCTAEPADASPLLMPGFSFKEEFAEFFVSEDSELNLRCLLPNQLDSLAEQQYQSSMDSLMVAESGVDSKKLEVRSDQLDSDIMHVHVDAKDKTKFDYVRDVLEVSGFSGNELLGTWHSDDQPVDPYVYEEVTGCMLLDPDCSGNEEGGNCSHLLMFDLINEVLMEIYERSYSYFPAPLSSLCRIRPMPVGYHVLKEVWESISWYLRLRPEDDKSLDYVATRDLSRSDGWMNLQFDSECVALEVEDSIFDDLLEEVIWT